MKKQMRENESVRVPKRGIDRLTHYTSKESWAKIQETKVIKPLSLPTILFNNGSYDHLPDSVKRIIGSNGTMKELMRRGLCLVGMFPGDESKWKEYGLLEEILSDKGNVKLSLPVLDRDQAFVRNHAYISPLNFQRLVGKDLWKIARDWKLYLESSDNQDIYTQACVDYMKSSVPLSEYRGDYDVPEIWVRQTTPIDSVQVLK